VALTRAKRAAFALAAFVLAGGLAVAAMFAVDVYLHWRVENLGAVNVWGYRGPTIGRKQPNEIRIVVLGGSTAFGYGLPYNEAFPYYLEQLLNAGAPDGRHYTVINLGAPGQGAYGFRFDLADYAYLHYDAAVLYEGYNDLGTVDVPPGVEHRSRPNYLLWRRESPVFRLTGYMPVLPLVFREKAMAMMAGGDLDAAYRGRTTFRPGLATRATASALQTAAAIADRVGRQLGSISADARAGAADDEPVETWRHYVACVLDAVGYAREHGAKVVVVTQPYGSGAHVSQQRAMASALDERFGSDPHVRYVNLGRLLNLRDSSIAYDGLHLVAPANRRVAEALVDPVAAVLR
jgi:lysophospholipase L1-like esterase